MDRNQRQGGLSVVFAQKTGAANALQRDYLARLEEKQAVALHRSFSETLPELPTVAQNEADIAWFIYDLEPVPEQNRYQLVLHKTMFTQFDPALQKITTPEAGDIGTLMSELQAKLGEKLENSSPPDAPTLADVIRH